jgi:hypothetical protein
LEAEKKQSVGRATITENDFQAIDSEGAGEKSSSTRRRWDAFNNWRTRIAGTGRLNR